MKFRDKLIEMDACREAVEWVNRKSLKTAWAKCEQADWMLWLAGRLEIDRKVLVLCACDIAETALKHIPDGEDRPAKAIEVTRAWVDGKATIQEVREARKSAYAAAYAAATATDAADAYAAVTDAAYAAYAAANDAAYAAYAAATDAAAAAATDAAAAAYADDDDTRKELANLVRKRIPYDMIETALTGRS